MWEATLARALGTVLALAQAQGRQLQALVQAEAQAQARALVQALGAVVGALAPAYSLA